MPFIANHCRLATWRATGSGCLVLLFLGQGPAVGSELPKTEDQLVATVQNALIDRDMSVFSKLVNWNQARPFRQRAVKAQISTAFGRPIRSVTLEAFPVDGLQEVEARGTLKANMNVSHQLRIVFDEPDNEFGTAPTDLFLVGRDQEGYRIALIVPVQTRGD